MLTINFQTIPLLLAVLAVNVVSLLDAISSLLLVDIDSCNEINPLMGALMDANYLYYFGVKLGITLLGTIIFWHFYAKRDSARWAFNFILSTYCLLMLWHTLLLTGMVR
jgi:hypothetical protein